MISWNQKRSPSMIFRIHSGCDFKTVVDITVNFNELDCRLQGKDRLEANNYSHFIALVEGDGMGAHNWRNVIIASGLLGCGI
jgi:hypothetical protein